MQLFLRAINIRLSAAERYLGNCVWEALSFPFFMQLRRIKTLNNGNSTEKQAVTSGNKQTVSGCILPSDEELGSVLLYFKGDIL